MLGHCYPLLLGFKGGKAVACFVGAFAYIAPLAVAVTIAIFILVVVWKPYISLGSVIAALLFPITVWLTSKPAPAILAASIAAGVLIVFRHKANIIRLKNGNEHVFSFKGKTAV